METKKEAAKPSMDNDKTMAALATLPVVGLIMFYAMTNSSDYVKHYARQGTILLLINIVVGVVGMVPVIGWMLALIVPVIVLVAWVMLLVKALAGEEKYTLPMIGNLLDNYMK